jgi:hypothetical protein
MAGLPTPAEAQRATERDAALARRRLGKLSAGTELEEADAVEPVELPSEGELARMSPRARAVVAADAMLRTRWPILYASLPKD